MTLQTRVTLSRVLVIAALLAVSAAAAAAEPAATPQAPIAAEPLQPLPEIQGPQISSCLRETGSRIQSHDGDGCLNVPGTSYDREALRSTGQVSMGAALRQLDPAIH